MKSEEVKKPIHYSLLLFTSDKPPPTGPAGHLPLQGEACKLNDRKLNQSKKEIRLTEGTDFFLLTMVYQLINLSMASFRA